MGIKSPFGYVDNERMMLETMLILVDRFCVSCHTNDDWRRNCHNCPTGNFLDEAKDYVRTCHIDNPFDFKDIKKWDEVPKPTQRYRSTMMRLQDEIKHFFWAPLCYHQEDYDKFRWRLAELFYWNKQKMKRYIWTNNKHQNWVETWRKYWKRKHRRSPTQI